MSNNATIIALLRGLPRWAPVMVTGPTGTVCLVKGRDGRFTGLRSGKSFNVLAAARLVKAAWADGVKVLDGVPQSAGAFLAAMPDAKAPAEALQRMTWEARAWSAAHGLGLART